MKLTLGFLAQLIGSYQSVMYDETGTRAALYNLYVSSRSITRMNAFPPANGSYEGDVVWVLDDWTLADIYVAHEHRLSCFVVSKTIYESFIVPGIPKLLRRQVLYIIVDKPVRHVLLHAAQMWREQSGVPVIVVTGSLGKTTIVEMIRTIFATDAISVHVPFLRTPTLVELALSLFELSSFMAFALFEVAVSTQGILKEYATLLQPLMAVVSGVSHAHLSSFGSLEAIAEEASSIFRYFTPSQIGVICGDMPPLIKQCYHHPIVTFGLKRKNVVQARTIETVMHQGHKYTKVSVDAGGDKTHFFLPGNHPGLIHNALAALTVCHFLHAPLSTIVKGLEAFRPLPGRFESCALKKTLGVVINDCAHAHPESMQAALLAFDKLHESSRKIAVLGDMENLGEKSSYWHRHAGRLLEKVKSVRKLILIGSQAHRIADTAPCTAERICVSDWYEAYEALRYLDTSSYLSILVHGASSLGMNELVHAVSE